MDTRTSDHPPYCQSAKAPHHGTRGAPPPENPPEGKKIVPTASFMPRCTVVQVGSPFPPAALPSPPAPHPGPGGAPFLGAVVVDGGGPDGGEHVLHRGQRPALPGQPADVAPQLQPAGPQGLLGVELP